MPASEWTDWQKWRMDVLKTGIGAVLLFALGYFFFDRFEQDRTERRALCSQKIAYMQRTLSDFESAVSSYRRAADNTLLELYRWRDAQPTEPIRKFWGPAYADLDAALLRFQSVFPGQEKGVAQIRSDMATLYKILDNKLIDPRLDRIETLYKKAHPPTAEEEWQALAQITRDELEKYRPQVKNTLDSMEAMQLDLAKHASGRLARPSSDICDLAAY